MGMIAVASSVQGYSHIKNDTPNHDTYCYLNNEEHNIFVAVVSDGAGSATNAKMGSSLCCYNLTQSLLDISIAVIERKLEPEWYKEKIYSAITKHIDIISELPGRVKSYNHTLTAVIFSPYGGKVIQIGDSPAVIFTRQENLNQSSDFDFFDSSEVFDEIKQGGYANVTTFVTNPEWRSEIRIKNLPKEAIGFFAMTDGAGSIFIEKNKLFKPAIHELFSRFKQKEYLDKTLTEFLSMDEVNEITGDDKTFLAYFPATILQKPAKYSKDYTNHNISDFIQPLLSAVIESNNSSELELESSLDMPNQSSDDSEYQLDKEAYLKNKDISTTYVVESKKKAHHDHSSEKSKNIQEQLIAVLVISVLINIVLFTSMLISWDEKSNIINGIFNSDAQIQQHK